MNKTALETYHGQADVDIFAKMYDKGDSLRRHTRVPRPGVGTAGVIMRGALRADHSGKNINRSSYIKFSSNYCYTAGRDPDFHIRRSSPKTREPLSLLHL